MEKILITNYVHSSLIEGLVELGFELIYNPNFEPENLENLLPELFGLVINSKIKMTRERIVLGKNLNFIARLGSGLEIIDLDAAKDLKVHIYNSPEGNRNAVAEHALGMLLSLSNNLLRSDQEVRAKIWEREQNRGFELENKTFGIVGMGNTGKSLGRKLSGWGLEVIAYDPYVLDLPSTLDYIEKVSLEELQRKADIISMHVQLTPETNQMVDKSFIDKCKDGVIFINTSRGKIIKTDDFIKALEIGKINGACLDVFENEKISTFTQEENSMYTKLYAMKNVVLSPHVAGWTHESLMKIAQVLLQKIKLGL